MLLGKIPFCRKFSNGFRLNDYQDNITITLRSCKQSSLGFKFSSEYICPLHSYSTSLKLSKTANSKNVCFNLIEFDIQQETVWPQLASNLIKDFKDLS